MKLRCMLCACCLAAVALPHSVAAQNYTFTNIADTTGLFATFLFGGPPRLNSSGTVSFTATLDAGGSGVYRSDGVVTTTIADESGPLQGFYFSDINDAGQIAFGATSNYLGRGIFRGDGLSVDTIIWERDLPVDSDKFVGVDRPLSINNAGTVAFHAQGLVGSSDIVNAIFTGNGGNITLISDPQEYRADSPQINNLGTVAFSYQLFGAAGDGIRLGNGGTGSLVIDDTGPYSLFGTPGLNDSKVVAVAAYHDGGGASVLRIDETTVDVVAGPYSDVLGVGLNNADDVAFLARVAPNMFGILTGPDLVADKVIGDGDALFASTVTMFQNAAIDGPNDAGQIVFRYSLADGRSGIALATPIPELAGDYNHDDVVDAADYTVWRKSLGQPAPALDADGNCNGQIDPGDYVCGGRTSANPLAAAPL